METGTPFTFNRDAVNRANPNKHRGMIYCSNLCTEIAQNMGAIEQLEQRIEDVDGEQVVVTVTKPGAFVVCNLASLSLAISTWTIPHELAHVTESAVRALDNVIDLNFFPVPYAEINNRQYRPIGLGVSGYHHLLAKSGIRGERRASGLRRARVRRRALRGGARELRHRAEKGAYGFFEGKRLADGRVLPATAALRTGAGSRARARRGRARPAQRLPAGRGAHQLHQHHRRHHCKPTR